MGLLGDHWSLEIGYWLIGKCARGIWLVMAFHIRLFLSLSLAPTYTLPLLIAISRKPKSDIGVTLHLSWALA